MVTREGERNFTDRYPDVIYIRKIDCEASKILIGVIKCRDIFARGTARPINADSASFALIDCVAITAMIVTCLVAPVTFLRAKIVGQYEPHDPLKSGAMVSITASCTTTPRRTFSHEEACDWRRVPITWAVYSPEQRDHRSRVRPSLSLPLVYHLRVSFIISVAADISKKKKKAHLARVKRLAYRWLCAYDFFFKDTFIIIYRSLEALRAAKKRISFINDALIAKTTDGMICRDG